MTCLSLAGSSPCCCVCCLVNMSLSCILLRPLSLLLASSRPSSHSLLPFSGGCLRRTSGRHGAATAWSAAPPTTTVPAPAPRPTMQPGPTSAAPYWAAKPVGSTAGAPPQVTDVQPQRPPLQPLGSNTQHTHHTQQRRVGHTPASAGAHWLVVACRAVHFFHGPSASAGGRPMSMA